MAPAVSRATTTPSTIRLVWWLVPAAVVLFVLVAGVRGADVSSPTGAAVVATAVLVVGAAVTGFVAGGTPSVSPLPRRVRQGLGLVLLAASGPTVAASSSVPSVMAAGLLALACAGPVGLLWAGCGWSDRGDRAAGATVWVPVAAAGTALLVGYAPIADPRCSWRCAEGLGPWTAGGAASLVGAAASALVAVGALAALGVTLLVRADVPGPVLLAVGLASSLVVVLWMTRTVAWGPSAGPPTRSVWSFLPPAALALGILAHLRQVRRARRRLAALVSRLRRLDVDVPTRDPRPEVHAPVAGGTGWVDSRGCRVDAVTAPALVLNDDLGRPWVRVLGEPGWLPPGAPLSARECSPIDRVLLDNLRAAALVQADRREVEASSREVVLRGDRERRRIERDLHDGVQQRLVSAGLHLALAVKGTPAAAGDALRDAEAATLGALRALRDISHGLYPQVLTTEGLATALGELVHPVGAVLTVDPSAEAATDQVRFTVYAVVQHVVDELVAPGGSGVAGVRSIEAVEVAVTGGSLTLELRVVADPEVVRAALREVTDRVEAVGGGVEAVARGSAVSVEVVLPCES
ncbi:sensor histidine kinase [Oryzobacter sp. R7]|uniref:sensor histidine kinase n=1 Tax=Oryzobacter faecalis TaxID=3388656 RepID=UPI00398CB333